MRLGDSLSEGDVGGDGVRFSDIVKECEGSMSDSVREGVYISSTKLQYAF